MPFQERLPESCNLTDLLQDELPITKKSFIPHRLRTTAPGVPLLSAPPHTTYTHVMRKVPILIQIQAHRPACHDPCRPRIPVSVSSTTSKLPAVPPGASFRTTCICRAVFNDTAYATQAAHLKNFGNLGPQIKFSSTPRISSRG